MKYLITIITALLLTLPVQAQVNVRVNLYDGITLSGTIKTETVPVKTKYGTLSVPIGEVLSISFGLHYDEGQRELIADAVKQLGSAAFKERDAATKFLVSQGQHTIPFLLKSTDNETVKRFEMIESSIKEQAKLFLPEYDVVQTRSMEIKGEVLLTNFEIACKHKELGIMRPKVTSIQSVFVRSSSKKIDLETKEDWSNTAFFVTDGSNVNVLASGLIDLHPASGGQYTATPKGYNTTGKGGRFLAGSLIGKIGNGEEFFIGESHSLISRQSGFLYLRIVDNPWNNPSVGRYTIDIKN